jgi:hypothetical protein
MTLYFSANLAGMAFAPQCCCDSSGSSTSVAPLACRIGKPSVLLGAIVMATITTKCRSGWLVALYLLMSSFAGVGMCALTGCERKEKVIDIKTPGADVEVERNTDTGKVDVEVDR